MMIRAALLLTVSLMAGKAMAQQPVQSYDSYRSWLVACDNTLTCVARGFAQDGAPVDLTVERAAGAHGVLTARVRAEAPFKLADLRLDGAAIPLDDSG